MKFFKDPWFLMSFALVVILGGSFFVFGFSSGEKPVSQNSSPTPSVNSAQLSPVSGLDVSPQPFDFGKTPMSKGIVSKTFSLKNKSGKKTEIAKIETSCMCTEASIKVGDKESPYFGMPGHTFNSGWQATIPPDGEALLTAKFDPAAHGPQGTGIAKRVVRVFFSDPPNTFLDVNFSADVIP